MDFDSLVAEKSGLGTAGIVVINNDQDIIKCMARIARFYKHESCGQCTPCREGSGWMWRMLERMKNGDSTYKEIENRSHEEPLIKKKSNIPYLIDQHLMEKDNA